MPDIEKWKYLDACSPFLEGEKYYIVVDSKYTTPGENPEATYAEAQLDGVVKLLDFYGKNLSELDVVDGLFKVSSFENKFVTLSEDNLVPMKVLISVPKEDFDLIDDDPSTCSLDIPDEKLVVSYPLDQIATKINLVASGITTLLADLVRSDVFISNIYIQNEISRLLQAKRLLENYFNINDIQGLVIPNPDCSIPEQESKTLTLGFDLDYKLRYVLVDNNQYTIGYNCLLEQSVFSHVTTSYYLTRLDEMINDLTYRMCDEFNWIAFLKKHTLPIPVVESKERFVDGVKLYDKNGNYSTDPVPPTPAISEEEEDAQTSSPAAGEPTSPRNQVGKTDEELSIETLRLNQPIIKIDRAQAAKAEIDYVGAEETSPSAIQASLDQLTPMVYETVGPTIPEPENNDAPSAQQSLDNKEKGKSLFSKLNLSFDVLNKFDIGLMSHQTLGPMLRCFINEFGLEAFEKPELQSLLEIEDCRIDKLNIKKGFGSYDIRAGGLVPQDFKFPPLFPNTKDYMETAMAELRNNLANLLIQTTVREIIDTFRNYLDNVYSNECQIITGPDPQFRQWLSESVGINVPDLDSPETFAALMAVNGGKGFSGILSNILSKTNSPSRLEAAEFQLLSTPEFGSLPIYVTESGVVQRKYLKQSDLIVVTNEILKGVDELSGILKPSEFTVLLAGAGPDLNKILNLATKILTRNASQNIVFKNREDVADIMEALGRMLSPKTLMQPILITTSPSNVTRLTVGEAGNFAREEILKRQDPLIPDAEIEKIINDAREQAQEKILKVTDLLDRYNNGDLMPEFPDLFGAEGLIKNIPPVVKQVSETTAVTIINPIAQRFSEDFAPPLGTGSYVDFWNRSLAPSYLVNNLARSYLVNNPNALYTNFSLDVSENNYLFGYTPSSTSTTTIPTKTLAGTTEYDFGKNFNADNKGLDQPDASLLLSKMKEELGLTYGGGKALYETSEEANAAGYMGNSLEDWYELIVRKIELYDTGNPSLEEATFEVTDPIDNNKVYEVIVDESNGKVIVNLYELEPAQQVDARPAGFSDDIIRLSLNPSTGGKQVTYKSDVYTISTSNLGNKSTTGELNTRSFQSGVGVDNFSEVDFNAEILSPEALSEIQNTLDLIDGNIINASIINRFVKYIGGDKYSTATYDANSGEFASSFNLLDLSYPSNDIFDIEGLKDGASKSLTFILNGSLTGEYCDSLSEIRRNGLNSSLRLLARAFIIEQAVISIQVFNGFDLAFMEDEIFVNSVYSLLKKEISKYQESFDTLETSLMQEIRDSTLKYYEILNLSGESTEILSTGKDAVRQLILDEAKILKEPITLGLNLSQNSNNWNEFLTKVVFGEYENINDFGTDTIMQSDDTSYAFYKKVEQDENGNYIYSYDLLFVTTEEYEFTTKTESKGIEYNFDNSYINAITLLSVQCERKELADDEDEVYRSLAEMMFETEIYNKVFNDISPIKTFIACLALYQHSALSDPATFDPDGFIPYIGKDFVDFMAKTKLTILQLLASAIYGGGKIEYQDPFIQKAQP